MKMEARATAHQSDSDPVQLSLQAESDFRDRRTERRDYLVPRKGDGSAALRGEIFLRKFLLAYCFEHRLTAFSP
jgi:hypothetical protein